MLDWRGCADWRAIDWKGLDLLRQELVLLVAVAQLARVAHAPSPNGAVGGEGEAVVLSNRHAHGALAAQRRREAGRRVEPHYALAVAQQPWKFLRCVGWR